MTADSGAPRFAGDAILDHIEVAVADAERSRRFYEAALHPFGMTVIIRVGPERTRTGGTRYGLGRDGYPRIWFHDGEAPGSPVHLALATTDRRIVDAFHAAALAAGGTDNGAPGIRERYHPNYYAAFVLDPDGNNIEAVCQVPDLEMSPQP
jgi:catechol 2,3-dioxygenase-like lactoylglutathione lyase family enzyme